ncbi:GmrSD restriction endonuclease domain-containing protein [Nitrincola sp. MINF-07-Sa-05]|uniref:GmrSD restriction endonuclease domain-containing protein n=1 Tax=Nitrincola salilacus TaxID=3400273 RepID=UPI003917F799
MKATEAKLLDFLKKSPQFVIPIYQRTYSWTEQQCRQLWDDIIRVGTSDDISAHFIGSVVYIEKGLYQVSSQSPLLVIDGQQRLTTAMLILEALSRHLGDREPLEGFSAKKLRNYYLLNPLEDGERAYKLLLTQTDKDSLLALVTQKPLPADGSLRIKENFEFFNDQIGQLGGALEPLCRGLSMLIIVDIALSRDQDNPQLIFESMNSTGKALSQADLIRNFILMGLEPEHQSRLYQDNWRPMEVAFGQEGYGVYFDSFMRHYLTVKTGDIPRTDEVYEAFKQHAHRSEVASAGVDALVEEIHSFARYFCAMALGNEPDKQLAMAFKDLRELKVDVAYPFLLELYRDYQQDILSRDDFNSAIRLIEAYVFRRAICAIPTNSLNKTFATFHRALHKDRYLESIKAHLLGLRSYRRFPNDEEFKRNLAERDLYNFRSRSYWLRRLENFERKERVPVDEYSIEHIMPQNENLSARWRNELGDDWQRVHETWLHTLGNLTLTGYNSEYSDRPFAEKRDMPGGFKQSPLRLNEGLGYVETWSEAAIKARAERLASLAVSVWYSPWLPGDVLETYRATTIKPQAYNLEDHHQLADGAPMRPLFEELRKEVIALDPSVVEEVLKLYVAFKAETNFVDVVPQKSRLRLSLNLPFHELNDPKGMAKDVTNLGRWGNGDVEVAISDASELPYVMGLIRQALEKQMGGDG